MLLTFSIEQKKKKILLCFVAAQPEDADVRKKPCTSGDDVCGRYATTAATKKATTPETPVLAGSAVQVAITWPLSRALRCETNA